MKYYFYPPQKKILLQIPYWKSNGTGWNKDGVWVPNPQWPLIRGHSRIPKCPFVQHHQPPVRTRKSRSREASHLHRSHGRFGFLTLHHSCLYTFWSILTEVWCFISFCVFWGVRSVVCFVFVGVLCLFRCFPVISGNNFCFCFSGDIALKKKKVIWFLTNLYSEKVIKTKNTTLFTSTSLNRKFWNSDPEASQMNPKRNFKKILFHFKKIHFHFCLT